MKCEDCKNFYSKFQNEKKFGWTATGVFHGQCQLSGRFGKFSVTNGGWVRNMSLKNRNEGCWLWTKRQKGAVNVV